MQETKWAEAVILIDADFLDNVAFDLTVNFERMLNRRIPQADLCHWLDCIALDGGLRPGANKVQAHFIHSKEKGELAHFKPSDFKDDLNGLGFEDNLGRFDLFAFPVEEVVSKDEFFLQSLTMLADAKEIKRLMIVGDVNSYGQQMKKICAQTDGKDITLFAMEPQTGRGFQQEILGYSLMSALGISGDELQR